VSGSVSVLERSKVRGTVNDREVVLSKNAWRSADGAVGSRVCWSISEEMRVKGMVLDENILKMVYRAR